MWANFFPPKLYNLFQNVRQFFSKEIRPAWEVLTFFHSASSNDTSLTLKAQTLTIRCQFHQRSTCSFYARRSQKCQMILLTWLSFFAHSGSTCVRAVRRTLMKLSPSVNFNVFRAAFTHTDPENAKKTDNLTVIFALLGYEQKLLVECWWNWLQVINDVTFLKHTLSSTIHQRNGQCVALQLFFTISKNSNIIWLTINNS